MTARPGGPHRRAGRTAQDIRRRVLSQNLLRGAPAADEFLNQVPIGPEDLCLEVGAGDGVLTERLATRCREVIAYEVDRHLAAGLQARLRERANVRIVVGDFLAARPPAVPFHLVGNVPFSITSSIVDWSLQAETLTAATLITQLEYAKKRAGTYGRWSLVTVRTWPTFSWELRGTISRFQFRPVPRVDAGVLHLERRPRLLIPAARQDRYLRMVELGFSGIGGSLYASLRREHSAARLGAAFAAAGLDRATLVAFVHPDQWIELFNALEARARRPS